MRPLVRHLRTLMWSLAYVAAVALGVAQVWLTREDSAKFRAAVAADARQQALNRALEHDIRGLWLKLYAAGKEERDPPISELENRYNGGRPFPIGPGPGPGTKEVTDRTTGGVAIVGTVDGNRWHDVSPAWTRIAFRSSAWYLWTRETCAMAYIASLMGFTVMLGNFVVAFAIVDRTQRLRNATALLHLAIIGALLVFTGPYRVHAATRFFSNQPGGWAVLMLAIAAIALIAAWRTRLPDDGVPRCPKCRYILTGNVSGRCPECGTAVGEAAQEKSGSAALRA